MKAVSILYHDVVSDGKWHSSGFLGPGTARYKLDRASFEEHLAAIAESRHVDPSFALTSPTSDSDELPFHLTFDDGGESAFTCVADILERYGWKAHFFVTAGYIGTSGFLNPEQIRALRKRGHVIGSHSFSHPERMSHLPMAELLEEWSRSVKLLSDILGEPVRSASVPRGFYTRKVAEAASESSIRVLFNSEPTIRIREVNGCLVLGRFTIVRGMPPAVSGDLVSIRSSARRKQWLSWNAKKILKSVGGRSYLRARDWLLGKI